MTITALVLATTRESVADFLRALVYVYTIILIAHIVVQLVFSLGVRVPYSSWSGAIFDFLRDTSEPYLRPWRKIIPMIGPLDLSPMVAIFALQFIGQLIANVIAG